MTEAEMLKQIDPFIIKLCVTKVRNADWDDVIQELRIEALLLARKYDGRVPWTAFAARLLPFKLTDIARRRLGRRGHKRDRKPLNFSSVIDDWHDEPNCTSLVIHHRGVDDVDWADLLEHAEDRKVRAHVLYAGGLTMRQVGERFGVSESAVCIWLQDPKPREELKRLLGVEAA